MRHPATQPSPATKLARPPRAVTLAAALVLCGSVGATLVVAEPAGAATTPFTSATGSEVPHLTANPSCVQAWSTGLTITYASTPTNQYYYDAAQIFGEYGSTASGMGGFVNTYCWTNGTLYSVFIPLSADEYQGEFWIYDAFVPEVVSFDLQVGALGAPAPPPTSCAPLPSLGGDQPTGVASIASPPDGSGYWMVDHCGVVGTAGVPFYGDVIRNSPPLACNALSPNPDHLNAPIVGIAATPNGGGYWLLGADGGIFTYGNAQFYGSTGSLRLNKPVVGIASTPDGGGYWLVASDGGIFAFGDAPFYGSMGGRPLNKPVVGMAPDYATGGYWLVASDGGVFSFNAPFYGSTGSLTLAQPIVGMEAPPNGSGYRFVASDGGVFCFNVPFEGALAGQPDPNHYLPVVGMAASGSNGYWLATAVGAVARFGATPF